MSVSIAQAVVRICAALAAFGSGVVALSQPVLAPETASAPSRPDIGFGLQPGGVLSNAGVVQAIGGVEVDPPETTRGAGGADLERVFEARCRAVVFIGAARGTGKDQKIATGTGSIVHSEGYVLTAAHVVAGANELAVGIFPNCRPGTTPDLFKARLYRLDEVADLALLKLESMPASGVAVMPLGRLPDVRTGSGVVIIGHPRNLLMSMSQGVVSAIRPDYPFGEQRRATVVQTDGALNPGNSGGPMMTQNGELIGVNSFILGSASAGLNFAVSVDDVRAMFNRKQDRVLSVASSQGQPAKVESPPNQECKPKVLKEWTENGEKKKLLDVGCTGKGNMQLVEPEDPGVRAYVLWDRNGDGKSDAKFYLNRQGKPETSDWDDDFDGTYEYRAEHADGTWDPTTKTRVAGR